MARRRELGSIASGIIGSFNSRNNDIDGYWGIGKLYKLVAQLERKTVLIDLKGKAISPSSTEFDGMLTHYHNMLTRLLGKHDIPLAWITSVIITAEFETAYDHKHHYWRSALGNPCNIKCDILDDNNRHHIAYAYNNCMPHDQSKENQSSRVGNL
ncbi:MULTISPECIES: hypothetical protein [unclassified Shewanella]|uniref:hypothetical protein n=1 Tax=unclassified Shewanella TaxID=196818 RepID=UPI0006D68B40|nr:hypothetical protein [Shewanella sp. P1-14-1]KPZ66992.1 hypothetical protein AN944_04205 [Shewanella sp. P1-14-1]